MRIVITGGGGFIGSALAKRLIEVQVDDEIILLDNLQRHGQNPELKQLLLHPQIKFINIDLSNVDSLKKLPAPVDRVYHLAAVVGVGPVEANPAYVLRVNTISTFNICEWFEKHSHKGARFLFSSSSEVYSGVVMAGFNLPIPTPESIPAVISDLDNPRFSYAISKMWGEAYLKYLSSTNRNLHMSSVRYHNVYGPGMGYDHVIPQIVSRVMQRETPFRMIAAEQTRSFCWVGDAVEATRLIMETEHLKPGITVHIGDQEGEIEIATLYEMIFDLCDWKPQKTQKISAPPGSVSRRCPDTTLMQTLTGYKPTTSLYEGLKKTVEWYKENPK